MKRQLFFLSLALLSSYSFADKADIIGIDLASANTYELEKVIISATGFEQNADNNLRNVIIISGKELQDKGYTSIEEALSRQAGIAFVRSGTGGNPSTNIDMRGQGASANFAVKVMVDGVSMNTLDNNRLHAAGVTISPLDSVSIEDIERIEIIPGGGAVLYGNGTRGGAINIITKKNKDNQAFIALEGNGFDNGNANGKVNAGFSGKIVEVEGLSFSTNIIGFDGNGYRDGDKDKGFYANSKLYFDINDKHSVNLGFEYWQDDAKSTAALTKEQFDDNPKQKGSSVNHYIIKRPELNAEYKGKFGDSFDMSLSGFWQRQNVKLGEENEGMYSTGDFKDTAMGGNFKGKLNYLDDSYFLFGYNFERHNSKTITLVRGGNVNSDDTKDAHSVFVLDSHAFNNVFSLSGGGRYEYAHYKQKGASTGGFISAYQNEFGTHTNNFALELTPNVRYSDTGKVYAKYERGYISPTPYQFRQKRGSVYSMNKDLKSETYDTYEVGLSDYLFGFMPVDMAVYYTLSKDEITNRSSADNPHAGTGNSGYYNLDKTQRIGVDVSLRQDFGFLSFYESFAFVDASIKGGDLDGKQIPLVSKFKVGGGIDYEIFDGFTLFTALTYAAKAKEDVQNEYDINDYFITDLGLAWKLRHLSLFAGAKNLFDKHYTLSQSHSTSMTGTTTTSYLPADGRSYYMKFQYKF